NLANAFLEKHLTHFVYAQFFSWEANFYLLDDLNIVILIHSNLLYSEGILAYNTLAQPFHHILSLYWSVRTNSSLYISDLCAISNNAVAVQNMHYIVSFR
ncbi:hypothetical protein ACJX0J_021231, partial [Zea mays]